MSSPLDPGNPNFPYLVSMMSGQRDPGPKAGTGCGCLAAALILAALIFIALIAAHG